ncbi:MAG TPA: hypothetical protein VMV94_12730 [Phycisphaerae bacterium]|nr:hypothetical protein [Phycisphaerae bacterium]
MKTTRRPWKLVALGKLLPVLFLYQAVGCLPDGAFKEVTAENILLTTAVIVQTVTAQFFNTLFGVA